MDASFKIKKMAAGTEYQPHLSILEDGCRKGNVISMRNDKSETAESTKVVLMGKPPRYLPPIRHCMSSTQLASTAEVVRKSILHCSSSFHTEIVLHVMFCILICDPFA